MADTEYRYTSLEDKQNSPHGGQRSTLLTVRPDGARREPSPTCRHGCQRQNIPIEDHHHRTQSEPLHSSNHHGTVYVMQLEDDRFFIGHTQSDLCTIVNQQFTEPRSEWVQLHRPVKLLSHKYGTLKDAEQTTLKCMEKYGWWNCRGTRWSDVNMRDPPDELIDMYASSCGIGCCIQIGNLMSVLRKRLKRIQRIKCIKAEQPQPSLSPTQLPLFPRPSPNIFTYTETIVAPYKPIEPCQQNQQHQHQPMSSPTQRFLSSPPSYRKNIFSNNV